MWTIEKISRFSCPSEIEWSPDGNWLSFVWQGGPQDGQWCLIDEKGQLKYPSKLPVFPSAKMWGGVQPSYCWSPNGCHILRVADGLWLYDIYTGQQRRLTPSSPTAGPLATPYETHPSWSPDGKRFAFRRDQHLLIYEIADGSVRLFPLPGNIYEFAPHLRWSPDGDFIAAAFRRLDETGHPLPRGLDIVVVHLDGQLAWSTDTPGTTANPNWLDNITLLFTQYNTDYTQAKHNLVNIQTGDQRMLAMEENPKGLMADFVEGLGSRGPALSPNGKEAILIQPREGWDHLLLLDMESSHLTQLTQGECEDSSPVWSPDGRTIAYLSNGHPSLSNLQVWMLDRQSLSSKALCTLPGEKGNLVWSPDSQRIAFIHAGPGNPPSLWVAEIDGGQMQQVLKPHSNESMWVQDYPPQEVWFETVDGKSPGLFYTRPDLQNQPAIIWLHGGPGMQYYGGWPADYTGCMHHAFHQYLIEQGYSVLYLNYRGSTGYGVEHEQGNYLQIGRAEILDVQGAAAFLSSLPQVDSQRLCIAGRSYGGFVTVSAMTRLPGLFKLGIVIAGLGDLTGQPGTTDIRFWDDTASFRRRMGSSFESNSTAWQGARPLSELENLQAPLVLFHGVKDQAVSIEYARQIETRCRELGKTCFAHYYPGEDHVFSSPQTWQDLYGKILYYLRTYLNKGLSGM